MKLTSSDIIKSTLPRSYLLEVGMESVNQDVAAFHYKEWCKKPDPIFLSFIRLQQGGSSAYVFMGDFSIMYNVSVRCPLSPGVKVATIIWCKVSTIIWCKVAPITWCKVSTITWWTSGDWELLEPEPPLNRWISRICSYTKNTFCTAVKSSLLFSSLLSSQL